MKTPNMLYRSPGPENFEGVSCETVIVDEPDVEAKIAEGWNRTWHGAADDAAARTAAQLKANEEEQARIAAELKAAAGKGSKKAADAT